jgi:hypothetical protein
LEGLRAGMLVLLSLLWWPKGRFSERGPLAPLAPKALPWTLAKGRSTWGTRVGSYSCFCSRARMLLFLTRDAFCRRSMEDRRHGVGEPERPRWLFSELKLRFCQNMRGDVVVFSKGDDWNGDESVSVIFLVVWFQLGEFRRFSVGDSSESGRGSALRSFAGDAMVLLLDRRRGCTGSSEVMLGVEASNCARGMLMLCLLF